LLDRSVIGRRGGNRKSSAFACTSAVRDSSGSKPSDDLKAGTIFDPLNATSVLRNSLRWIIDWHPL
jgi:hypothetical protein